MTLVTGSTRLLGILGDPVTHSRSPQLHNAVYRAEGRDAVYVPFPVASDALGTAVAGLRAVGLHGANVTVPHKRAVLALVDDVTDEARLVGAANTLHLVDGRLVADNTDARGLATALTVDVGTLAGESVVVVGAGGAARAAVVALVRCGARPVVVARRAAALAPLVELARATGGSADAHVLDDEVAVRRAVAHAHVVVNATPLGLHDEPLPDAVSELAAGQHAYDLLYRTTAWQAAARAAGATAHDGLRMLVEQAALSHARWFATASPSRLMWATATA